MTEQPQDAVAAAVMAPFGGRVMAIVRLTEGIFNPYTGYKLVEPAY